MANIFKKLTEGDEVQTPIETRDDMYKRPIKPVPATPPKVGVDLDSEFYETLIAAAQESKLDIAKLESFSQISQNRNQIYTLIDTMAEDSTIAAVLETYAEDATEVADNGRIVWAESLDPNIAKFVLYLLDTMNVDKNAYRWVYSLIKYGDLYLRLYRESEYNDKLFDSDNEEDNNKHLQSKKLNEDLDKALNSQYLDESIPNQEITDLSAIDDLDEEYAEAARLDNSNSKNILQEDINVKLFSQNDRYVHYLEMVPNPAEMYELTRFGKSYAYIQAPVTVELHKTSDTLYVNDRLSYSFKRNDINLFEATEFVHGALEDNSSRTPEEVNIFIGDEDTTTPLNYTVRRGQSLLYNTYKIWRENMLLEYALLLNRVTKSSIIRIIGVEVGDMPKEQIGPHLQGIKSLIEQKSALNIGGSMSEYTNPGPVENNIYVPTHNQIGSISPQQIGGDVNVTGLDDLDFFNNKLFGSLRVPKQYFGFTDDSAGFDGGTSLSIISSRYAKTVKRVQNTFIQAITDAINLMLIDKGLTSYVNKFTLHMVPPTTREEIDRRDAIQSRISVASDIMMQLSEVKNLGLRLKALKALLAGAVDPEVTSVLQEEIDRLEGLEAKGIQLDENGEPVEGSMDETGLEGAIGGGDFGGGDFGGGDFGGGDFGGGDSGDTSSDDGDNLPSPADLGLDLTDNDVN